MGGEPIESSLCGFGHDELWDGKQLVVGALFDFQNSAKRLFRARGASLNLKIHGKVKSWKIVGPSFNGVINGRLRVRYSSDPARYAMSSTRYSSGVESTSTDRRMPEASQTAHKNSPDRRKDPAKDACARYHVS